MFGIYRCHVPELVQGLLVSMLRSHMVLLVQVAIINAMLHLELTQS